MSASATFFVPIHAPGAVTSQPPASGVKVDKHFIKIACSNCNMRELCMPIGLDAHELKRVDELVTKRPFVKRGSALFRAGDT